MNTTLTLVDLGGAITLLIWGVHMVQTGITRLRPATPPDAKLRARQPVQGLPGRGGRDVDTPEQHGHGSVGDGIRRRRARRPGAGTGRDAVGSKVDPAPADPSR